MSVRIFTIRPFHRPSVRPSSPRRCGPALHGFSKDVRRICHPDAVDEILISGPVYQEAFYHPDWGKRGGQERRRLKGKRKSVLSGKNAGKDHVGRGRGRGKEEEEEE